MSSYKDWIGQDVEPEQTTKKLTGAAYWKNWWHYSWPVVLGVILGAVIVWQLLSGMLGIGQVEPDYQIAYVGSSELPEDTVTALTDAIAAMGNDENGDGQIVVTINQYVMSEGDENAESRYAASVRLTVDLADNESYFWLLEDPDSFQEDYTALALLDGSCPQDGDTSGLDKVYKWSNCPVLSALDLGTYQEDLLGQIVEGDNQELLSGFYFGRRCFYSEEQKNAEYLADCSALWDTLTSGAVQ